MSFARRLGGSARASSPTWPRAAYNDPTVVAVAAFFLSLGIGLFLARPFSAAPIAFDAAASVVHFDRIVSGQVLEVPLTTTPKPVLTVVYGVLHAVTGDWRALTLAALVALATSVGLATLLARRLAGPTAAAFVAVALAGSSTMAYDAARGLATSWAALGWVLAGLAITERRPRYGLAGLALLLAALSRIETLLIIALALAALALATNGPRSLRRPVPRRSWLIGIGLLAVPVMMAHDWLLIRDPLFWLTISSIYSATQGEPVGLAGAAQVGGLMLQILTPMGGVIALAVVGAAVLVRRRQVAILLGLIALVPGVAAFLLVLGARGLVVPGRYTAPIEVGLIFAAGLGLSALRLALAARPSLAALRRDPPRRMLGPVIGVIVAVLLSTPFAPFDASATRALRNLRLIHAHATSLLPDLRRAVEASPTGSPTPLLLVPDVVRPRLALELPIGLDKVEGLAPGLVDLDAGYLAPGQLVLHDRRDSGRIPALEVGTPTAGSVEALFADPQQGVWLVRVLPR